MVPGALQTQGFVHCLADRAGLAAKRGPAGALSGCGPAPAWRPGGGGFGQPEAVSVAVNGSWSALFGGSNRSVRMSVHSEWPTPLESTVMPL